jgi:hypothetical protein
VSVGDTSSSMGRLTLNVLLSFAQFERELIGERVRDEIAASKRKGLWVGGPVPLSTVSWSLAGFAAGEAICWCYLWIAALRVLGTVPARSQAASTYERIDPVSINHVLPARADWIG